MMRVVAALTLLVAGAQAFAPARPFPFRTVSTSTSARAFGLDPSVFHDVHQHLDSLQHAFSTFSLADAVDSLTDAASSVPAPTDAATDAAADAASNNGWFGFLTGPIAGLLQLIHSGLAGVGVPEAWGISIIALTLLIKLLTFPLTKTQLESTTKMQGLQPAIKEIQAKYQSNQEVMNQKIAEFYQVNEINPLAGCLPSLVQIPVFIGLYRAVLTLAKDNKLDEAFLWLPSLEGPTYGADPAHGSDWILKNWVDGVPPLGWDDTIAFLVLPLFLVVSQFVSMELMQPKTDDPNSPNNNIVLKLLPLMIGWFSLNVPSALGIYWVTNNIVTTATSLAIRNSVKMDAATPGGAATMSSTPETKPPPIFTAPREKPAGFGEPSSAPSVSDVKPITAMDVEIVEEVVEEDTSEDVEEAASEELASGTGMDSKPSSPKKRKRGKKGKKRKN